MQRRLEDRIRQICARAVVTDNEKLIPILDELRIALREHAERVPTAVYADRRQRINSADPKFDLK